MGRKKLPDPPVELKISLPISLYTRLSLLLFSEAKGRVPHGAFREFFTALLADYFARRDAVHLPAVPADAERCISSGTIPGPRDSAGA